MAQYMLYGRQGSGSFAVQVALEEIGVPYERIWVTDEAAELVRFRTVNPTGKVPALRLPDGVVMFESSAMLLHLALAHPAADLAPVPGTVPHALFLQWMVYLSANVYEAVLRVYYPARYSLRGSQDEEGIRGQGTQDLLGHLSFIGQGLSPYVLGSRYSIADVYLYMLAAWYPGGTAPVFAQVPALRAHAELLASRAAVRTVEADHRV